MLMNTVLDMVEVASDIVKDPTPMGTMGESLNVAYDNVIMGQDLIKYAEQLNDFTQLENTYIIRIGNKEIREYLEANEVDTLISKKYKYEYKGQSSGKYIISFSEI